MLQVQCCRADCRAELVRLFKMQWRIDFISLFNQLQWQTLASLCGQEHCKQVKNLISNTIFVTFYALYYQQCGTSKVTQQMFALMRLASNPKVDLNTQFQKATSDVGRYTYYGNLGNIAMRTEAPPRCCSNPLFARDSQSESCLKGSPQLKASIQLMH